MAELESKLTPLLDPPLAEPPSLETISERASRIRRRRRGLYAGTGGGLAVLALVVAAAAMPDSGQTVRSAGPANPSGAPTGVPGAAPATTIPGAVVVGQVRVDGEIWRVLAWTQQAGVCMRVGDVAGGTSCGGVRSGLGVTVNALVDTKAQFVYGPVDKAVTRLHFEMASGTVIEVPILGADAGFAVNFYAHHVRTGLESGALVATMLDGTVKRLDNVLSLPTGPPPSLPVLLPPPPPTSAPIASTPTSPTSAVPPDAAVPPVVSTFPPPVTTAPAPLVARVVTPLLTAINLQPLRFESATAVEGRNALRVRYWSGVAPCSVLGRVDVTESAGQVTVKLLVGSDPAAAQTACIAIAAYYETIVPLSGPLGTRVVVDGAA